jgi:hypothetical protein
MFAKYALHTDKDAAEDIPMEVGGWSGDRSGRLFMESLAWSVLDSIRAHQGDMRTHLQVKMSSGRPDSPDCQGTQ